MTVYSKKYTLLVRRKKKLHVTFVPSIILLPTIYYF